MWSPDGDALWVNIHQQRSRGLQGGLWRYPLDGEPSFMCEMPGELIQVINPSQMLIVEKLERHEYAPRRLTRRSRLSIVDWGDEFICDDLAWQGAASQRPGATSIALVKAADDSLWLWTGDADADRLLWRTERTVRDLCWSADGQWLSFTDIDPEYNQRVKLMNVDSGEVLDLGAGKRAVISPE